MTLADPSHGEAADYLDVLLLCAAPLDVRPALNLAVEVANFESEVRRSPIPIRLRRVFPPTLKQLERELSPVALKHQTPRVFHFLGHGEEDYLWFETEEGAGDKVTASQLRKVFQGTPIRLALLNACWSATSRVKNLCRHLVDDAQLEAAIGHGKPVADVSAIAFARRFYGEITRGETIHRSFQAACNHLAETGLPGAAEVELVGQGESRLDEGLKPGERPGRVEDGMPTRGYLPGVGFFCGRADEYAQVARTLSDPAKHGFGLWGMSGIGKTALALEVARRNAWRYPTGGVVFVDARDVSPPSTSALLQRVLTRLDRSVDRGDDTAYELISRLTVAPGLVVLDNLETLPATELDSLARFVKQVPRNGSHILLTARAPLGPIEELPDVATLRLTSGLHDFDGAQYAHRYAETKDVLLLRNDPPRLEQGKVRGLCAQISRRVSGHPKMIEVAVGVARRGRDALDQALAKLDGDLEAKLEELLSTGLTLVGDEGRRLLVFLPLFPAGNFMPEAMGAVRAFAERAAKLPMSANDPDEDGDDVEAMGSSPAWVGVGLRQLERGGFLDLNQKANVYTFHQTLLDYAESKTRLAETQRAAGFFGLFVRYAQYLSDNRGNDEAIDRCLGNVLILMDTVWAGRDGPGPLDTVLTSMVDALGYTFGRRGLWQFGDRWHERAIEIRRQPNEAPNEEALAHQLYRRAILLSNQGKPDEARAVLAECMALSEKAKNQGILAASLHQLAIIESDQGNPAEARRLLQRSMTIQERIGDVSGRAATLAMLAQHEAAEGHFDRAVVMARESIVLLERIGDPRVEMVRRILAAIEVRAAGVVASAPPFMAELAALLERAKVAGPENGLAMIDEVLAAERKESAPDREAVAWLARSALCWGVGDAAGFDESLRQVEDALERVEKRNALPWPSWWPPSRPSAIGPNRPRRRNPIGCSIRR